MANFIVSFRIASDKYYNQRYESFVSEVHNVAGGTSSVWEETSSFFVFEWEGNADELCEKLYFSTLFDPSKDQMLIIDVSNRKKAVKGQIKYPDVLESYLGF